MTRVSKTIRDILTNPIRLFDREPEPELFFTDISVNKKKVYKIKIFDVCNPEVTTVKNNANYWVYRCELIEGFNGYNTEYVYHLHFPAASFIHAWDTAPNLKRLSPTETFDCWLTFRRESKKRLVIVQRDYSKVRMQNG